VKTKIQTMTLEIEMEIKTLSQKIATKGKLEDRICSLIEDFREGREITDFRFDQVYPSTVRSLSTTHWSPVDVATRAADFLADSRKTRILDVGSGSGKFCTVAALSSHGQFIGIEQQSYLADVAKNVANALGAKNAAFIHGNMADLDWSFFDAFYFFNPFYENKMKSIRIDGTMSMGIQKFNRYIEIVRTKLRTAKTGTKVATYHGFGGEMPLGYQLVKREPIGTSILELWVKVEMTRPF